MTETPLFRIAPLQASGARARQALMIAANELRLPGFSYRGGYQLADEQQRVSAVATIRAECNVDYVLPDLDDNPGPHVYYLVIVDREPAMIPEEDVLPTVFGIALAKGGVAAARRVSYRPYTLPAPADETAGAER